jgi:cobalt-zinc-cadmium efflux system membrane fusion protein
MSISHPPFMEMRMPSQLRNLMSMLLGQLPTVLTLGLLGVIAWWGYVWDWKIPSLPELLHPSEAKKTDEAAKSEEKKGPEDSEKPLPPIKLASEDAVQTAGIQTREVERRIIDATVKANGEVEFDLDHYAHLSTRAGGTVWSVHKRAGDEVKKGDVLALVACPELARLKFDLQQTLLTVQTRERYYERLKATGTSTAVKDKESAEFSLRDARIALSKDQQSLHNLGLYVPLDDLARSSDERIASRLRTLGIPETLLQSLDADATTGNNLLPMYAPFDGVVIKRDIVVGEMVNPGSPQFVLADLSRLWIMLYVRLEDAGKLSIGQEVVFHLEGADEDTPPAKINWIGNEVDEKTHTLQARADAPNAHGRLRPHTFGTATVRIRRETHTTVPNEALQFDGVSHFVFVAGESPTEFQPMRVTLGPEHEKFTVVLSGVRAGQKIVTSGSRKLLAEMLKENIAGGD